MKVLVIAEHNNEQLNNATLHTLQAAQLFAKAASCDFITVLVAGFQCEKVVNACALLSNVDEVLCGDDIAYQNALAEPLSQCIKDVAKNYSAIFAPSTTFGKNILPRLAAMLDMECVSDVCDITSVDGVVEITRPIYAGNALETLVNDSIVQIMTVRTTAFSAVSGISDTPAKITTLPKIANMSEKMLSNYVSLEAIISKRPELTQAKIVVSGGRGFQDAEKFKLIEALADKLGAAIGASRAAVDAGFAPNDYQVGQTGKMVAPNLYIALGISGAIQHVAGMKDSRVIVAINKDPEAPIFKIATYGLVGDLFSIIPELIAQLDHRGE